MSEIFDNAIEMTTKIFRSTPTRWPMRHPDTGEIVKPSNRGITVNFDERTQSGKLNAATGRVGETFPLLEFKNHVQNLRVE